MRMLIPAEMEKAAKQLKISYLSTTYLMSPCGFHLKQI